MPNHCNNTLTVVGPYDDIDEFIGAIENEDGTVGILDNLYPIPEALTKVKATIGSGDDVNERAKKSNMDEYGYSDWYDWCNAKWGTKWGDYDARIVQSHSDSEGVDDRMGKAMIEFDSAWSPPEAGIEHISTLFPKVLFDLRYEEPGMCFTGVFQVQNGTILAERCVEYIEPSTIFYMFADENYDHLNIISI